MPPGDRVDQAEPGSDGVQVWQREDRSLDDAELVLWATVGSLLFAIGLLASVLFAEHVQRCPEAVALVCGQRSWTYRELDDLSHTYPREMNAPILNWLRGER